MSATQHPRPRFSEAEQAALDGFRAAIRGPLRELVAALVAAQPSARSGKKGETK